MTKHCALLQESSYSVDLAFGPKDGNDVIYGAAVLPLVDLALQVPIRRLQV
jgi:hypothetical protein